MRLVGKIDGTISSFDRADWLTPPFDLGRPPIGGPYYLAAGQSHARTERAAGVYAPGAKCGSAYTSGALAGEACC